MTIKTAIEKAEKEGYELRYYGTKELTQKIILLDPEFWKYLGKGMGWEKEEELDERFGDKTYMHLWLYHWHRLIDHLAEGKDINSFFEQS